MRHNFRCPCWTCLACKLPAASPTCETYAKSNLVVVGGEITTKAKLDFSEIAREAIIRGIGYTNDDDVFHADKVLIMNAITSQSPDIAQAWMPRLPTARNR